MRFMLCHKCGHAWNVSLKYKVTGRYVCPDCAERRRRNASDTGDSNRSSDTRCDAVGVLDSNRMAEV